MRLKSVALLRAFMEQKHMGMGRLARYAGCSKGFISHLLAERRYTCTPTLAERIAEALDVPVEVLFTSSVTTTGQRSDASRKTTRSAA